MKIDKDTKIYGSFSNNTGSNGTIFFNDAFKRFSINAIYKSFYSDDIEKLLISVKYLNFSGFALSSPHKIEIIPYLDSIDDIASEIGSVNTVINKNNKLIGYNTDWIGVKQYFDNHFNLNRDNFEKIIILGNGGFSKSVQYYCKTINFPFNVITRENWDDISKMNGLFFNATPIDVSVNNVLLDGRSTSHEGKLISYYQSIEQFKLYTGIKYE